MPQASSDNLTRHSKETQAQRQAREVLRDRAILHEAEIRDVTTALVVAADKRRKRKHPPLNLSADEADLFPVLCQYSALHDDWPPALARSSKARIRHLNAMHGTYGRLALLRLSLPELDEWPLFTQDMSVTARKVIDARMSALTLDRAPYTVNLQRGEEGGTHAHACTPLLFVSEPYQQAILDAPHGPKKGCELPSQAAHGVVILNTLADRRKVSSYLVRHPDGRLDDPQQRLSYLSALEDELVRKAQGGDMVRLGWMRNVLPIMRSSTK